MKAKPMDSAFRGSFQQVSKYNQHYENGKNDPGKSSINADICPSRFDMLKRNNRNQFNQFQEFQEEREYEDKILQNSNQMKEENGPTFEGEIQNQRNGKMAKTSEKIFIEEEYNH